LALLVAAAPASAHVTANLGSGIGAGFLHPLTGFDRMLAMVSIGIWGAELGAPAIWLLPIVFPLIMAVGAVFGVAGVPLPGAELLIALSVLTLGVMVALAQRLPLAAALVIVGIFGFAHGHAHGAEMPNAADALSFTVGFVIATGLLHAVGIAIGLFGQWQTGARALRAGGVLVALAGCYFLYDSIGA
jgi:urease accessory protein